MKLAKFALWSVFVVALLVAPFVVVTKGNDYKLARFQSNLVSLPHPATSRLVAQHGKIGNFGNGNHIDYWAVEVRSCPNPRAMPRFYQAMRVPVPNYQRNDYDGVKNGTQPVEITVLPSPLPANYHLSAGYSKWNLGNLAGQNGLYTVEIVNSGENDSWGSLFDWRGQ